MANDKTIPELIEKTDAADLDELVIFDKTATETKKIKYQTLKDHAPKSHGNEAHSSAFITGSQVPSNETDPNIDTSLKGITKTEVQDHAPKSHGNEAHSSAFNLVTVEVGTGATKSLTTVADQRVVVIAKGNLTPGTTSRNVLLNYNAVQKDIVVIKQGATADVVPFCLEYTEIPGAATHDITVTTSGGTLANIVILVFKIL